MIDLVPSSSTLNASPPEVLREPDSSFAVMVKDVATPAVMVATGVPIDFVASVGCKKTISSAIATALQAGGFICNAFARSSHSTD